MSAPGSLFRHVHIPDYLVAENSDWNYYVHDSGNLESSFSPIGVPDEYVYERLWMRPERVSSVDLDDRGDGWETVTRDKRGRFQPAYCWIECSANDPNAVAFYGARYA